MKKEMVGEVPWAKVLGMVEDLICKLRHGKILPEQLAAFLKDENPFANLVGNLVGAVRFPIFKTITLGVCKSVKAYREALTKAGFLIGDWASDLLNKIQVSQSQVQLDLAALSVVELGFNEASSLDRIYTKAKELGLELCPPEVGPALRLAEPYQPYAEWLRIAMEPISDSAGGLKIFEVGYDCDGRWLFGGYGNPAFLWSPGDRFVFAFPRSK